MRNRSPTQSPEPQTLPTPSNQASFFRLVSAYAALPYRTPPNGRGVLAEMPALAARETIILLWLREAPESNAYLEGIDPRIRRGYVGIGNMHEPHFRAPVVFAAQKMQSECAGSRKVHSRRPRRDLRVGEKRAACNSNISRHAAPRRKIPLQRERIQPNSVCRIGPLRQQKHRHNVHRVLKS